MTSVLASDGQSVTTPKTMREAEHSEDREFWIAGTVDELANHKFHNTFSDPVPLPIGEKATPTRWLLSTKVVDLSERNQDSKSNAYKQIDDGRTFLRYRTRLLYLNNPWTSQPSEWTECYAPVVDKTSVRIYLTVCAMKHRTLVHSDVVSAYLHAHMTGPTKYIRLPGDEKGMARILYKALNGVDNAGQLWHKHYDKFMHQEGFMKNCTDPCLYHHSTNGLQGARYVDDILSSCDPGTEEGLQKFLKKLAVEFKIRNLGEPKKFLGMEIAYFKDLGFCCITRYLRTLIN